MVWIALVGTISLAIIFVYHWSLHLDGDDRWRAERQPTLGRERAEGQE